MAQIPLPTRGLHLEYESHGNAGDPAVILVMGLGMQLIAWPPAMIEALVGAGFRVIAFDNRDVGLSGSGPLSAYTPPRRALLAYLMHRRFMPAYRISDLADDTLALADALGIERFAIVGASLGGMIAQTVAACAPMRVHHLVSIMSSAGPHTAPWPDLRVLWRFLQPPPRDASFETRLDHFVALFRLLGPIDDAAELQRVRDLLARSQQRGYNPAGAARQLLAVLADPDRSAAVARIACPMLIIHGAADPLIPVAAARHLQHLLPQAQLEIVEGLGHYFPADKVARISDRLLAFLRA